MTRRWYGFTLIELLVVVVAISLVSAVAIPRMLALWSGGADAALHEPTVLPGALPESALPLGAAPSDAAAPDPAPPGALPVVASARIDVALSALASGHHSRRHAARLDARLQLEPTGPADEPVRLELPFPEGAGELVAVDFALHGRGRDGPPPAGELQLSTAGLTWVGLVDALPADAAPGDEPLIATLSAEFTGRERFVLALPVARQLRGVSVHLDPGDVDGVTVDPDALQPARLADGSLQWTYDQLVSARPIAVDFPVRDTPLGRAMRLFRLAGLAVLLFGAGFWYLGELYRPGRLDGFRWGHFLLLALTDSFFFVVLAVLGHRGWEAGPSLALAAGLSLPLLAFHVATIFDARFAWTRAVPLAALTMTVVANGIYGGAWQSIVYVAVAFVALGALTLTYPALHRRGEQRRAQRRRALQLVLEQLAAAVDEGRALLVVADTELRHDDAACLERLRTRLEEARSDLAMVLGEVQPLVEPALAEFAGLNADRIRDLSARAPRRQQDVERARQALDDALEHLRGGRRSAAERVAEERAQALHCAACGGGVAGSRYCPDCGERAPQVSSCRSCGHELRLPSGLLGDAARLDDLHCMACGEPPRARAVVVGAGAG